MYYVRSYTKNEKEMMSLKMSFQIKHVAEEIKFEWIPIHACLKAQGIENAGVVRQHFLVPIVHCVLCIVYCVEGCSNFMHTITSVDVHVFYDAVFCFMSNEYFIAHPILSPHLTIALGFVINRAHRYLVNTTSPFCRNSCQSTKKSESQRWTKKVRS